MEFLSLLPRVVPVVILLLLGFYFRKSRFIGEEAVAGIKKLIVNISLPALLFLAFLEIDFQLRFLVVVISVLVLNLVLLQGGRIIGGYLRRDDPYLSLLFTGFEMGMLGIPLFTAIYGAERVQYMGIIDLGHELFIWFIFLAILFRLQQNEAQGWQHLFKSFISSPVIIAILLGILFNLLGLQVLAGGNYLFRSLLNVMEMLSGLTAPLILLIIGFEIDFSMVGIKLPLKIILLRLLMVIPLALLTGYFVFRNLLGLEGIYLTALFSMVVLPPPFIIPLFIEEEELAKRSYIVNTLSLNTIISVLLFIAVTFIFS